jgi:Flp pilus assembly protein TadD
MNPRRRARAAKAAEARGLVRAGRAADALSVVEPLIRVDPRDPELLALAARCKNILGQHAEAIAMATRSLALLDHPEALHVRGDSLRAIGKTAEAVGDLRRAMAHAPDSADLRIALVATLEEAGRAAEARTALEPILAAQPLLPGNMLSTRVAYEHSKLLVREGALDEAVRTIDAALPNTQPGATPFLLLLFLRAKALDRAGDFVAAWCSAMRAHSSRAISFDPLTLVRATDEAIAWWTTERIEEIGHTGLHDETAIFVAGMPRSGTSLVDQIIDSHPNAAGVGELDSIERWAESAGFRAPTDHTRVARQYLAAVRQLAPGADRIVNKALGNFRILGHLARAFPATKIVHVVRDPRDVAVSCTLGAFGASRYPWTSRPEWVAVAWHETERLMAHWSRVLRVPIHEVAYEELVTAGEPRIRTMLEFLGLEWNPNVMRFHESSRTVRTLSYDQVSRPLYSNSVGRWLNYERALAGVKFPAYPPHA